MKISKYESYLFQKIYWNLKFKISIYFAKFLWLFWNFNFLQDSENRIGGDVEIPNQGEGIALMAVNQVQGYTLIYLLPCERCSSRLFW